MRALPATTCFGGTVERLKRRITNVLGAQKKRGLGVVALVLALTLTAGCAVGWGERGRKNDDPFDGSRYNPVLVTGNAELTIGKNFRPSTMSPMKAAPTSAFPVRVVSTPSR